jgi:hypothetical protein
MFIFKVAATPTKQTRVFYKFLYNIYVHVEIRSIGPSLYDNIFKAGLLFKT